MYLSIVGMRLLEIMFFVGIIGSAVVVIITSIQDVEELFDTTGPAVHGDKTP